MSPGLTAAIICEDPVAFKAAVIQDNIARDNNLLLSSRWGKPEKERMMAAIEKRRHTLPVLSMFGTNETDAAIETGIKKRQRRFSRFAMNFGTITDEEREAQKAKLMELKFQRNMEKAATQSLADKTYINTIANGGSYKVVLKKNQLDSPILNNNSPKRRRDSEIHRDLLSALKSSDVSYNEPIDTSLLYPGYKTHKSRRSSLLNFKTPFMQLSPMTTKKNKLVFPSEHRRSSLMPSLSPGFLKHDKVHLNEESEDKIQLTPKRSNSKKTSVHFKISSEKRDSLDGIIEEEEEEESPPSSEAISSPKSAPPKNTGVHFTFPTNNNRQKHEQTTPEKTVLKRKPNSLFSSNAIYLPTGQPIKIRKWTRSDYLTYVASTISYNVIDYLRINPESHQVVKCS